MPIEALCVYCGSSPGSLPQYTEESSAFGALLARAGITLIYGGGNVGLMGAIADAALREGGKVIGVIPKALALKELAHRGQTELRIVHSMHERKSAMAKLADGFVALPGGIGTLEEIFEMVTWSQLGLHTKPHAFLNVAGYYDQLYFFLQNMMQNRFLKKEHMETILIEKDQAKLISSLQTYIPMQVDKWIDRNST